MLLEDYRNKKNQNKMNREKDAEECDAKDDDSSIVAGLIKSIFAKISKFNRPFKGWGICN